MATIENKHAVNCLFDLTTNVYAHYTILKYNIQFICRQTVMCSARSIRNDFVRFQDNICDVLCDSQSLKTIIPRIMLNKVNHHMS